MNIEIKAKDNPRVIAIQKIYGKFYNKDEDLTLGKHCWDIYDRIEYVWRSINCQNSDCNSTV